MQRVEDDLSPEKIGRPFFISLLIAPLFPAYGHSRRVSCDAFGRLEDTEYLLSAVTFGWWTNGTLYQFNDPDRTVISRDADPYHGSVPPGSIQTLKEARSRVDASIITGTVLLDSDDLIDPRAQQRAEEITHQRRYSRRCARGAQLPTGRGRRQHASLKTLHASEPDGSVLVAVFTTTGVSLPKSKSILLDSALTPLTSIGQQTCGLAQAAKCKGRLTYPFPQPSL